jgi:acyl carrier protein
MHEEIKEAVILVKEDEDRAKFLCAYVVSDTEMTVSQLRGYLAKRLPDYMCPAEFIRIKEMPLTLNGKIDRKTLESYDVKLSTGKDYAPPKNKIEKIIASIWQEVLHTDRVSIHDNFFDLGGDSIKILKVMGKTRSVFKRDIPVVALYRYPSISTLSDFLHQNNKDDDKEKETEEQKLNQIEETLKETIQLFDEV